MTSTKTLATKRDCLKQRLRDANIILIAAKLDLNKTIVISNLVPTKRNIRLRAIANGKFVYAKSKTSGIEYNIERTRKKMEILRHNVITFKDMARLKEKFSQAEIREMDAGILAIDAQRQLRLIRSLATMNRNKIILKKAGGKLMYENARKLAIKRMLVAAQSKRLVRDLSCVKETLLKRNIKGLFAFVGKIFKKIFYMR